MTDIWSNLDTSGASSGASQSADVWGHLDKPSLPIVKSQKYDPAQDSDTFTAGFGKFMVDTARGAQQIGAKLGNKVGLVSDKTVADIQSGIDEAKRLDAPLMESTGGKVGYGAGMATGAALLPGESLLGAAAAGAAEAGVQPVATGESRAANVVEGALGGAAGAAVGKVAGAALKGFGGSGAREAAVQTLQNEGIPLTVGQKTGAKLAQHVERASAITGDDAAEFAATQKQSFNRAVLKRVGVTDPEVTAATPDVLSDAKKGITDVMNDVSARNNVHMDTQLSTDLKDVQSQIERSLPQSDAHPLNVNLSDIEANAATNGGVLDGQFVQKLRSNLSALERNPSTAPVAGDLKDVIDSALTRSAHANGNSADVQALAEARRQYRALKQIEPAIDPSTGDISPLKLINALSVKANRSQALYGKGDQSLMDLARAGKQILPDTLGNSGTAERVLPAMGAMETLASGKPLEAGAKLLIGKTGLNAAGTVLRNQGTVGKVATSGVPGGRAVAAGIGRLSAPIGIATLGQPAYASEKGPPQ